MKTGSPYLNTGLITRQKIIVALLILGCVLRLYYLVSGRSLWSDEAALAMNIIDRPISDVLKPLIYDQGAPVGFLFAEHLVVKVLGPGELALRLLPFLAGIASLFALYYVARRILSPGAVPVAVGLFAIIETVVYYSSEIKQYSSDVLIALLIIAVAVDSSREPKLNLRRWIILAVTGAVVVWFSHPAIFVLAGIGLALGLRGLIQREWRELGKLIAAGAVWVAVFGLLYVVSLKNLTTSPYLHDFWTPGFMPLPPRSIKDIQWFIDAFYEKLADKPMRLYGSGGLASFLLVVGSGSLFRKNRYQLGMLLFPIAFTLAASALQIYPFMDRLILFLVPIATLLIAQGADVIYQIAAERAPAVGIIMLVMLFINPVLFSFGRLLQRPPSITSVQQQRPIVDYVMKNKQPKDVIYVEFRAQYSVHYYAWFYGQKPGVDYQVGVDTRIDSADYQSDINKLCGNGRVWFVFSRFEGPDFDEWERRYTAYLDNVGLRLDKVQDKGAVAYLYDLSKCTGQPTR